MNRTLDVGSSFFATLARVPAGMTVGELGPRPEKPLELYSFEISPYCRIARETLCTLEIPYLLRNVGKNSPSRPAFEKRSGKVMVPYLVDPNTDTEMFESADIVAYLERTYAK